MPRQRGDGTGINSFRPAEVREAILAWLGDSRSYEYGRPARLGVFPATYVATVAASERGEHHASVEWLPGEAHSWDQERAMVHRLPVDIDAGGPDEARRLLRRVLAVLRRELLLRNLDVHFTGCKGYRVWVYLAKPVPSSEALPLWRSFIEWLHGRVPAVDVNQVKPRAMARLPYTLNAKCSGLCVPVSREGVVRPADYAGMVESFDAVTVDDLKAVVGEPEEPAARVRLVSPGTGRRGGGRWEWVRLVLERGLPDGRRRFIWLVLSRWARVVQGLSETECVELAKRFIDASCRNHGNCSKIYDSAIREFCRAAGEPYHGCGGRPCLPWSLETIRSRDPDLFNAISSVIGEGNRL